MDWLMVASSAPIVLVLSPTLTGDEVDERVRSSLHLSPQPPTNRLSSALSSAGSRDHPNSIAASLAPPVGRRLTQHSASFGLHSLVRCDCGCGCGATGNGLTCDEPTTPVIRVDPFACCLC